MVIYAHRGESKSAPENTMAAFYMSLLNGTSGIETDVRRTGDGILVLNHDKTIDRVSNGIGKVSDYTYEELLKYDFNNNKRKKNRGEKIVKLEDFLKYISKKEVYLLIEIKESGYEKEIVDLIKKYNSKYITVSSFKYDILKRIHEMDKKLNLGWLLYEINNVTISQLKDISANQAICTSLCLDIDDVYECHNNNFIVTAWGVLGQNDIKRLKNIGVDRFIYNSYTDAKKILMEK